MTYRKTTFLLFLFAFGIFFYQLGAHPLLEPDEGRYANIAEEMVRTGEWLVPHKNGFIHFHKPPMTYWWMALGQKVTGVSELGVRLPNVLFAIGILGLVMALMRRLSAQEESILSGLIFLAIPLTLFMGRLATTDIGLLFWSTLAIYLFVLNHQKRNSLALLGVYAALGMTMMTKGPVGLILFAAGAIPFAVLFRKKQVRNKQVRNKQGIAWLSHCLGFLIFLTLSLSWYLWAMGQYPGLLNYLLVFQTANRIAGHHHHMESIFYFFPVLLGTFLPWSFYIPAAIRSLFKGEQGGDKTRLSVWFALWAGIIFLFFSVLPSKLASYILPMAVPIALWMALFVKEQLDTDSWKDAWFKTTSMILAIVFWVAGMGLGVYGKLFMHERLIGLRPTFLVGGILYVCAGPILYWLWSRKRPLHFISGLLIVIYLTAFALWTGLPRMGTYKNVRPYAEKILELRKPGEPVIAYRKLFSGLPFYLKERVIVIGTKTETTFDTPQDWQGYYYEKPEAIDSFMKGGKKLFILTKTSDARELIAQYGDQLTEHLRSKKVVLFEVEPA